MNAERRPLVGTASMRAGGNETTLARPSDSDARLAGKLASARVALLEPFAAVDRWPCSRRCMTLGVRELVDVGRRHGGLCPCWVDADSAPDSVA